MVQSAKRYFRTGSPVLWIILVGALSYLPAFAEDVPFWVRSYQQAQSLAHDEKYDSAIVLCRQAISDATVQFGASDTAVGRCLILLGKTFFDADYFKEAESSYQAVQPIFAEKFGNESMELAGALDSLAVVYSWQGKHLQAAPLRKRSLSIREKVYGPHDPQVAVGLNGLALEYLAEGKFTEAVVLNQRALAIREAAFGPNHSDVAMSLNNLAHLYVHLGRYSEAELLLLRALNVGEKTLGPDNFEIAAGLSNLARLYVCQGRYSEAKPLLQRALTIDRLKLGATHPYVALKLSNLGTLSLTQGEYAEAGSYFSQALEIQEKVAGDNNPEIAKCLTYLAEVYRARKMTDSATALLQRSLAIDESSLGPNHPAVSDNLYSLAQVDIDCERFSEAMPLIERSLSIRTSVLGPNHPDVAQSLLAEAAVYRSRKDYSNALASLHRAVSILQASLRHNGQALAEDDALRFAQTLRGACDQYLSCYFESRDSTQVPDTAAIGLALSFKGMISDEVFSRHRQIIRSTDSITLALADAFRSAQFQYARLFTKGPGRDSVATYRTRVDSAANACHHLEAELSRRGAFFPQDRPSDSVCTEKIVSSLPQNSVLLEFIYYTYSDICRHTSEPHYAVALIGSSNGIAFVDLGRAVPIESLVDEYRDQMSQISARGGIPTTIDQRTYFRIAQRLYDLTIQPIKKDLLGSDLVLISPDAALNLVSFAGLIDEGGKYLVESYPIQYESAGRDLLRLSSEFKAGSGLLALGDPDFNAPVTARQTAVSPSRLFSLTAADEVDRGIAKMRSGCAELQRLNVSRLPGSGKEAETVVKEWKANFGEDNELLLGPQASEENFKHLSPGKRVLHLATHGFFVNGRSAVESQSTIERGDNSGGENPLLLSGLLLAGANLHGQGCDSTNADDGILSAMEVSSLNLEGTELVVLSACESGLGRLTTGEGIYGLRRAFQMAGARSLVTSLWEVNDMTMASAMSVLYTRSARTLPDRIRLWQLEQLKNLRSQRLPDHPYLWAPMVSQGDWRSLTDANRK